MHMSTRQETLLNVMAAKAKCVEVMSDTITRFNEIIAKIDTGNEINRIQVAPQANFEAINKAAFVRDVINSRPSGVYSAEIRKEAVRQGVRITNTYMYAILNRLLKQGDVIKESDGRYVAIGSARQFVEKAT